MSESPLDHLAELLATPEARARIWQMILDGEASEKPKLVRRAKGLRKEQEEEDRARGFESPPPVA